MHSHGHSKRIVFDLEDDNYKPMFTTDHHSKCLLLRAKSIISDCETYRSMFLCRRGCLTIHILPLQEYTTKSLNYQRQPNEKFSRPKHMCLWKKQENDFSFSAFEVTVGVTEILSLKLRKTELPNKKPRKLYSSISNYTLHVYD